MKQNNVVFGKRKIVEHKPHIMTTHELFQQAKEHVFTGEEHRFEPRKKTLKTCKVVFNNHYSVFDGIMVNLSNSGAMVKVKNPAFIANEFLLTTTFGKREYLCAVKWRDSHHVGVEFEDG